MSIVIGDIFFVFGFDWSKPKNAADKNKLIKVSKTLLK